MQWRDTRYQSCARKIHGRGRAIVPRDASFFDEPKKVRKGENHINSGTYYYIGGTASTHLQGYYGGRCRAMETRIGMLEWNNNELATVGRKEPTKRTA